MMKNGQSCLLDSFQSKVVRCAPILLKIKGNLSRLKVQALWKNIPEKVSPSSKTNALKGASSGQRPHRNGVS